MLKRITITIFEIVCEIMLNSQAISKNIIDPDDTCPEGNL